MENIKIIFMGTPDFSVPVLTALINNYNVIGVVTKKDAPIGRHHELKPSPIKVLAEKHNIKVFQPTKIKHEYQDILDMNPDMIVTCAYGQIIPKEILDFPKYGCINVHASLLPKNRGGAPIHRAIINGEEEAGITIMYMAEGMDDGDIITTSSLKIEEYDNVGTLHDKLSTIGAKLIIDTIPNIVNGNINRIKQNDEEATYAYTIKKEDEYIDFNNSTKDVYNKIRGLYPFPIGYTILDNKIIKICEAKIGSSKSKTPGEVISIYNDGIGISTSDGEVILTKIKPEGKKEMLVSAYLNGIDKEKIIGKILGGIRNE